MSGPLSDVKVIEMAGLGPTPSCGMMLADMGADVIRVDRVSRVDFPIDLPPHLNLRDRNKRSVAIDLKRREGIDALFVLIEQADILIEGYRPGVAERMGFGPQESFSRRPGLVYARATGWGQDGPLAHSVGHDINYIALTGALDMIGDAGGRPIVPLNLLGDYAGGAAYLAYGILCALHEARRSGRGQVVDGAMIDGVSSLLTMFHAMRQAGLIVPERGANMLDGGAPFYTTYRTSDGLYIAVGALEERFYQTLISALGLDLTQLPDRRDRSQWSTLRSVFSQIFAQRTRDDWADHFTRFPDACVTPVLSLDEAGHHPHNATREALVSFEGAEHPHPAPRLSKTPGSIRQTPPRVGEHSREVLRDWGVDQATIERGLEAGIFLDVCSNAAPIA